MKSVTLRRVENIIRQKGICVSHFVVEYVGKEDKVTFVKVNRLDQINWLKVKSVDIIYKFDVSVYAAYDEGDGDGDWGGPIFRFENHHKVG